MKYFEISYEYEDRHGQFVEASYVTDNAFLVEEELHMALEGTGEFSVQTVEMTEQEFEDLPEVYDP